MHVLATAKVLAPTLELLLELELELPSQLLTLLHPCHQWLHAAHNGDRALCSTLAATSGDIARTTWMDSFHVPTLPILYGPRIDTSDGCTSAERTCRVNTPPVCL